MTRLGILFFFVCIFSCKSPVPKDVMAPKKMQAVLWDVMQADEIAEYYSAKDSSFRNLSKHVDYYQKVFAVHKISKEDFTRSLTYYEDHPATLKIIFDSLQSFGERLKRRDSINKSKIPVVIDSTLKRSRFQSKHP